MSGQQRAGTSYGTDRKYILCDNCGAPVEVPVTGGRVGCGFCGAALDVRVRGDIAAAAPTSLSDPDRLARLRSQDPRLRPPVEIAHLFAGSAVATPCETEARGRWQQLRGQLRSAAQFEAAEQLFFLTMGLAEMLLARGETLAQRALVESALEVLSLPRHRQVLTALLARSACSVGDLDAAERWLASCDPCTDDLHALTAFRFARAYIDTTRGDMRAVLATLERDALVRLGEAHEVECAVLGANAWERQGQERVATDVLVQVLRESGPLGRERARHFIRSHPALGLCKTSAPRAERRASALDPEPPHDPNIAVKVLGSMAIVWALAIAISIVATPIAHFLGMKAAWGGFSMTVLTGFLLVPLMGGLALLGWKRVRGRRIRREKGRAYSAHVLSSSTGPHPTFEQEGVLEVKLDLLITPLDSPAYRAGTSTFALKETVHRFVPGARLVARTYPGKPTDVVVEVE